MRRYVHRLMALCTLLALFMGAAPANASSKACVIILHGLARTEKSMKKMASALTDQGYQVVNNGYPSRKYAVPELARVHIPEALAQCGDTTPIHFVTHSMGGILVRQYMQDHQIKELHRVVMLGPPNQGSQVVDKLKKMPGFRFINGPAGMQLGTQESDIPKQLKPIAADVGVIAGTKSINLILSLYLPNPDDGKVSVENTKLPEMVDHITVPVAHPFLMKDDAAIRYTLHFLAAGRFSE